MTAPQPEPGEHHAEPDEHGRRWWIVNAIKRPHVERDVAHAVLTEATFYDMLGANTADDDARYPVGTEVVYAALLTDQQVAAFRGASNALSVVPDMPLQRLGPWAGDGRRGLRGADPLLDAADMPPPAEVST